MTNERERQEAEGHACSLMHRYRAVDTVVRTCRLSGQLQENKSKNLSFETSGSMTWRKIGYH